MENNTYRNESQDKRLDNIEKSVKVINHELGEVKTELTGIKTDVAWLKKFFFIIAGASLGALITGILTLLFK